MGPQIAWAPPQQPKSCCGCCCFCVVFWVLSAICGLAFLAVVVLDQNGPDDEKWTCTNCQASVPEGVKLCDECDNDSPGPVHKSWTCHRCKKSASGTKPKSGLCFLCIRDNKKKKRWTCT